MAHQSVFKYVFWAITGMIALLVLAAVFVVVLPNALVETADRTILFLLPLLIIPFGILTLIAVLVYRDAAKRGLDPWLWATVATYVPNLVGVIIYLVVRFMHKKVCLGCGQGLQADYKICPYCGHDQSTACPKCGKPTDPNWSLCPFCGQPLKTGA
ncbi:MAG TPA: zinc ribbon domain-containing protein [Acidobacteriota bacterium]|nr:zinc ribbon domain-containing protein [Acidobacteriota bacterium]HQP73663.1 zinc ribbon domain-containing protein [Acidobacteriota bacterium]